MKKLIVFCAMAAVLFTAGSAIAGTWTTIDAPGATATSIQDIDGNTIVGNYTDASGNYHGFLYNGTTWTTLTMPGMMRSWVMGISGNNIAGYSDDYSGNQHNFVYNKGIWTNVPQVFNCIYDIDGNNVVGSGSAIYNIETKTAQSFGYPGANGTSIRAISGNKFVGWYSIGWIGPYIFLYDGTNWSTLFPGGHEVYPDGIDGSNIVGSYDWHGFVYNIDIKSMSRCDMPGIGYTTPLGVDGNKIVGWYSDSAHKTRGFIYTAGTGDFNLDGIVNFNDLAILCSYWLQNNQSVDIWPPGGDGIINFLDYTAFANHWLEGTIAGDINGDSVVDFLDYAILARHWLDTDCMSSNNCGGANLNFDDTVDFGDFALLAGNWLEGVNP